MSPAILNRRSTDAEECYIIAQEHSLYSIVLYSEFRCLSVSAKYRITVTCSELCDTAVGVFSL